MLNFKDFVDKISSRYDSNSGFYQTIDAYKTLFDKNGNKIHCNNFLEDRYNKELEAKIKRLEKLYNLYKLIYRFNQTLFYKLTNSYFDDNNFTSELKCKGLLCKIQCDFIDFMMEKTEDKVAVLIYCEEKIKKYINNYDSFIDSYKFIKECLFIPINPLHSKAGWSDSED